MLLLEQGCVRPSNHSHTLGLVKLLLSVLTDVLCYFKGVFVPPIVHTHPWIGLAFVECEDTFHLLRKEKR